MSLAGLLSPAWSLSQGWQDVSGPVSSKAWACELAGCPGWLGNRGSQSPTEADLLLRGQGCTSGEQAEGPPWEPSAHNTRSTTYGPQPLLAHPLQSWAGQLGAPSLSWEEGHQESLGRHRTARTGAWARIRHTSPAGASQPGWLSSGAKAWSEGQRSSSAVWVAKAAGRAEPICALPTRQRGWAQAVGQEPGR